MSEIKDVREQYEKCSETMFATEEIPLGSWTSYSMVNDPKHLVFTLARYKFVAKMLQNKKSIMEVGCGDGFGLPIVADVAEKYYAVDWDDRNLNGIMRRLAYLKNVEYQCIDFNNQTMDIPNEIDAAFAIDVIEHIDPNKEDVFMRNIIHCITDKKSGTLILGTPNITASQYASELSALEHINLKSMHSLRNMMERYFYNVFTFGMNDEVIHTGYDKMCHYIWAIGCGIRE